MSISPLDSSAGQPAPSPVVGKASTIQDPIVSAGSAAPADRPISAEEVSNAVATLNASALAESGLSFSTDKESGLTVVTITDKKTDEVIRQLPSKEALALTHSIDETLRGNLINQKA